MNKIKRAVGRPLAFETAEQLQKAVDAYFTECDNATRKTYSERTHETILIPSPRPYTVTGLATALGLTRHTLIDYEQKEEKPEYQRIIKAAKGKIETYAEESLYWARSPAGAIFNLKNNWGWRDETTQIQAGDPENPMRHEIDIVINENYGPHNNQTESATKADDSI